MKTNKELEAHTLPNGYSLAYCGNDYLYYSLKDFVRGVIYHIGMDEGLASNRDEIDDIVTACITWKDNKKLIKEMARKEREIRALKYRLRVIDNRRIGLERQIEKLK